MGTLAKRLFLFSLALAWIPTANATWMPPDDEVPIERLLANLQQQLSETPDAIKLIAQIARVHSRAYALDEAKAQVAQLNYPPEGEVIDEKDKKFRLYEYFSVSYQSPEDASETLSEARLSHLLLALDFYKKAAAHPEAGEYEWLGLGYTSREGARHTQRLMNLEGEFPNETDVEKRRQEYLDQSLQAYEKAFRKCRTKRVYHSDPVAFEAGKAIVAILSERSPLDADTQRRLKATRRKVAEVDAHAKVDPQPVTPIIFHPTQSRAIGELLAPTLHVNFDLDGSGAGKTWPWVQPDTALLVWDADGLGNVPSGRSLIGSVTWWLFWNTGYDVLKALDDNRNGWLEGPELQGLAAWKDRNSNGIADAGEVQPLAVLGVNGLNTAATSEVEGMPASLQGIRMEDGRVLATYDWIVSPIPGEKP